MGDLACVPIDPIERTGEQADPQNAISIFMNCGGLGGRKARGFGRR